jgi:hypothetical protein
MTEDGDVDVELRERTFLSSDEIDMAEEPDTVDIADKRLRDTYSLETDM